MADTLVRFRQRSDINSNWVNSSEVYSSGELLFDLSNNTFKIGNNTDTWDTLDYADFAPSLLDKFQDVTLSNPLPIEGSVFTYVTVFWKWRAGPSILDIDPVTGDYYYTLSKLEDVDINYTTIANGDILVWNFGTLKFEISDIFLNKVSAIVAPSLSTDSGEPGEIRFDNSFIYVCVTTNTWKRAQMFTW